MWLKSKQVMHWMGELSPIYTSAMTAIQHLGDAEALSGTFMPIHAVQHRELGNDELCSAKSTV